MQAGPARLIHPPPAANCSKLPKPELSPKHRNEQTGLRRAFVYVCVREQQQQQQQHIIEEGLHGSPG